MAILGTVIGDTVGSRFEMRGNRTKEKDFEILTDDCIFTDDTVLTIATADCILNDPTLDYTKYYQNWAVKYPMSGFGGAFHEWMYLDHPVPYNSFGNGSAMRVSPVGYAYETMEEVLENAKKSAEVTHNHPEGIKGAQATAACVFMARKGYSKQDMKIFVENTFGYDLNRHSDDIRPGYGFDVTCQGSVPESIICFFDSVDFEDCIRICVSMGGDSDTMAAIAGSIAEPFYKDVPDWLAFPIVARMTKEMRNIYKDFNAKYDKK